MQFFDECSFSPIRFRTAKWPWRRQSGLGGCPAAVDGEGREIARTWQLTCGSTHMAQDTHAQQVLGMPDTQ